MGCSGGARHWVPGGRFLSLAIGGAFAASCQYSLAGWGGGRGGGGTAADSFTCKYDLVITAAVHVPGVGGGVCSYTERDQCKDVPAKDFCYLETRMSRQETGYITVVKQYKNVEVAPGICPPTPSATQSRPPCEE